MIYTISIFEQLHQDDQEVLQNIITMLKHDFHIEHSTIQIETLNKHSEMVV